MRESKNWSQEEMAAKLNMSVNGYSKIERGETKAYIPKLEQISEVLEMDLMELMSLGEKHVAFLIGDVITDVILLAHHKTWLLKLKHFSLLLRIKTRLLTI